MNDEQILDHPPDRPATRMIPQSIDLPAGQMVRRPEHRS